MEISRSRRQGAILQVQTRCAETLDRERAPLNLASETWAAGYRAVKDTETIAIRTGAVFVGLFRLR